MDFNTATGCSQKIINQRQIVYTGILDDQNCTLCELTEENISHLFITCDCSAKSWRKLQRWMNIKRAPTTWGDDLVWPYKDELRRSLSRLKSIGWCWLLLFIIYGEKRMSEFSNIKDNYQILLPSSSSKEIQIKVGK